MIRAALKLFLASLLAATASAGCRKRPAPPPPATQPAQTAPAEPFILSPSTAPQPQDIVDAADPSASATTAMDDMGSATATTSPAESPAVDLAAPLAGDEEWAKIQSHFDDGVAADGAAADAETEAAPPSQADLLTAEGVDALRAGEHDRAAECFYAAFEADPNHLGALRGLAEAYILAERFEDALPIYAMVLGMEEDDQVSRFNVGVVLSRLRRFAEAEETYRRILADDEEAVQPRYNLASLYQAQGKLNDARREWLIVTAEAPQLASAHNALAEVQMDLGDALAAMRSYAEAAKLRGNDVGSWLNLARAARAAGSLGRQIAAMEKATELAPQDAAIWSDLAAAQLQLHRETGRRDLLAAAVASWRKCAELDPSREDVRDWIATYAPLLEATEDPAAR